MNLRFRDEVWRGGFRPTAQVEEFENNLRAKLGLSTKYESARLSIGRSLAEPQSPAPVSSTDERGKPIAGEHLFGAEIDLWIATIIIDGGLTAEATIDDFRTLVEAHWARGGKLLQAELQNAGDDEAPFMARIAEFLPTAPDETEESKSAIPLSSIGELVLTVGSVSKTYPAGKPVDFVLNGQGTAPHIALMGRIASGKTTTGIHMALQICAKARVPLLLIDPKGELVDNGALSERLSSLSPPPTAIEVGEHPIPLDFLPGPGVGSASVTRAAMQFRDSIVSCCRGVGNIQQDLLRQAVEQVIMFEHPRDLVALRDWYKQKLVDANKDHDSVLSRLNELTTLKVFESSLSMSDFFGRSWVISLKTLGTEELKRLIILLLLDALKAFILPQPDTTTPNGFRTLRHLLVIDEARRILADKKYQSLVDLVRQGRSKGQVIMLLSQDPSDFEGHADDFTTQLGTVISFACAQSQRGLRALQGAYGRRLQPSEFSDTYLPTGVAFAKLPGREAQRVQCWTESSTPDIDP